MQSARIAEINAKFPSSLTKIGQFTARHVGQHGNPLDRHTSLGLRDYTRNPWHTRLDTTRPFSVDEPSEDPPSIAQKVRKMIDHESVLFIKVRNLICRNRVAEF